MIEYSTSDTRCRNQMLLRYFGEKNPPHCQRCDVCLSKHESGLKTGEFETIQSVICQALNDGLPHPASVLADLDIPVAKLQETVSFLVREEVIHIEKGLLVLDKKNPSL